MEKRHLPASPSDSMLMSQLAEGDIAALGELYIRYGQYVESAIWRFSPHLARSEVEDLAQDVFLRVRQLATRYREQAKFKAWIYKIAVQIARHAKKTMASRFELIERSGLSILGIAATTDSSPESSAAVKEAIQEAMDKLSKDQWEVLMLFEVEGFSAAEIGHILEISPQAVWTRLSRARARLVKAASRTTGQGSSVRRYRAPLKGKS